MKRLIFLIGAVTTVLTSCQSPDYAVIYSGGGNGGTETVYVYEDNEFEETLKLCDESSPYALTGAIFAKSEENIQKAYNALRFTAGNFYINDKPTGAVVAQQPFGGARASGTNDKAGGPLNLLRWISPRSVKRTNMEIHDWTYPFMNK